MLDRNQIYEADRVTVSRQGISSQDLMERAAAALYKWINGRFSDKKTVFAIFCGPGNNGGDGLALARLLSDAGYAVQVFIVQYTPSGTADFESNLKKLSQRLVPIFLTEHSEYPFIDKGTVVIDAIFGIGLNRTPAIWVQNLISQLNTCGCPIIAIDIPSGLELEKAPENQEFIIQADVVLTLGTPKLALCLPQAAPYVKSFFVLDIGLDCEFLQHLTTAFVWVDLSFARTLYRPRMRFSHKGSYGHVVIIGGQRGSIGAPLLAAKSAMYSGAGLVTAYIPSCGLVPIQAAVPEVMVQTDSNSDFISEIPQNNPEFTFVIGMGMGQHSSTKKVFLNWLPKQKKPIVLDADALNILSQNPHALKHLPQDSILTPHPGELKRLIGPWSSDFQKIDLAREFSLRWQVVLVVKGSHTIIFHKGMGYVNSTGNPGMATAGSGDVLGGLVGSLLAQHYTPLQAALLGVFLHGFSGDSMVRESGQEGLTASGLITGMGKAFQYLYPNK